MKFILAILLLIFSMPSFSEICDEITNSLRWLDSINPEIEAANAVKNSDSKFLAVMGFSLEIPGIDEHASNAIYQSKNYTIIEGTGDDLCSEEHERLNELAYSYASIYNQALLGGK